MQIKNKQRLCKLNEMSFKASESFVTGSLMIDRYKISDVCESFQISFYI